MVQQWRLACCTGSHAIDANRIGPSDAGGLLRVTGKVPGCVYSVAVKSPSLNRTKMHLDRLRAGPQKPVPGQKLGDSVSDSTDRADLIATLRTVP